ncbi:MAG: SGNH/GDSL hydrolase family protein [Proteobacteria bacterium]|nr:SGNH/GDSL hydrolase family protein [Pseudomonadota bacterium]
MPALAVAQCPVPSLAGAVSAASLPQTAARLKGGQVVRILAIGSSTTAGVGSGGLGFAHRLGPILKSRFPRATIEVVVSGVSGETASGAAGRLASELVRHKPLLVVWQVGTNDANFGVSSDSLRATVSGGIRAIRAAGAEALLVDPQYSRWAERSNATEVAARIVAEEAGRQGVPVVRRYAAMRLVAASNRSAFDGLIAWDGLHLTASGHACMAEQVAGTIAGTAR